MKNKKGFTLIELLAVIIILGILMIIAIPSVTSYINNSRKEAYVDTAKEIVSGTRNIVNTGKLGMYDTNTTYYIPASYIQTENSSKSPYGDFTQAYVGVIYDGKGYKYYWTSVDDTGQGVNKIILSDKLEQNDVTSDIKESDIEDKVNLTGIGNREKIVILEDGVWSDPHLVGQHISENGEIGAKDKDRTIEDLMDLYVKSYMEEDYTYMLDIYPPYIRTFYEWNLPRMPENYRRMKEQLGEGYVVSYSVGDYTEFEDGLLEDYNNMFKEEFGVEDAFSECRHYNITLTFKGPLLEQPAAGQFPFCKYDGVWYMPEF